MSLIKCKNCGNTISDKAIRCPKCGILVEKEEPPSVEHSVSYPSEKGTETGKPSPVETVENVKTEQNPISNPTDKVVNANKPTSVEAEMNVKAEQKKEAVPSPQREEAKPQVSKETAQDETAPHPKHKSWLPIIIVSIVLLLLCCGVGGYFYYTNIYLPEKTDREAPRYYTFGNVVLRSSKSSGVDFNKIGTLAYGTKLITYEHDEEWSRVKVESPNPDAPKQEGFVASPYLLGERDFFLLNSIFGDVESKEAIPTAKCKLALLAYFKEHQYVGKLSATIMEETGLSFDKTESNQWQVFVRSASAKPNEVFYKRLVNRDSKFTDFAVIIRNINTGQRKLIYFYFDDDEAFHFHSEQEAPPTGFIQDIRMDYFGGLDVSYSHNNPY